MAVPTSPLEGQESGQAPGISAGASSGATLYSWMRSTALKAFSARLASRTCASALTLGHQDHFERGAVLLDALDGVEGDVHQACQPHLHNDIRCVSREMVGRVCRRTHEQAGVTEKVRFFANPFRMQLLIRSRVVVAVDDFGQHTVMLAGCLICSAYDSDRPTTPIACRSSQIRLVVDHSPRPTVMLVSCVICSAYDSDKPTTEAAPPCSTASAAAANADRAPSVSSRMLSHLARNTTRRVGMMMTKGGSPQTTELRVLLQWRHTPTALPASSSPDTQPLKGIVR